MAASAFSTRYRLVVVSLTRLVLAAHDVLVLVLVLSLRFRKTLTFVLVTRIKE